MKISNKKGKNRHVKHTARKEAQTGVHKKNSGKYPEGKKKRGISQEGFKKLKGGKDCNVVGNRATGKANSRSAPKTKNGELFVRAAGAPITGKKRTKIKTLDAARIFTTKRKQTPTGKPTKVGGKKCLKRFNDKRHIRKGEGGSIGAIKLLPNCHTKERVIGKGNTTASPSKKMLARGGGLQFQIWREKEKEGALKQGETNCGESPESRKRGD